MTSLRILLTGATGTAGRATLDALVAAGHVVVTLGRSDPGSGGDHRRCDIRDARSLREDGLRGQRFDAVVSCLASRSGAPQDAWEIDYAAQLNLLNAAEEAGIAQFVLLSAICVQKPKLAFQEAKLAFEAALERSEIVHSIVRPTAYFKSLSGQVERVRAGKPFLVFGDGQLTACKPISDRDLGRFIASCVTDSDKRNAVLPIGGPGPAITPMEQAQALCAALGRPLRVRRVPVRMIDMIAAGLGLAGGLHKPWAQKAELARIGRYYATESMLVWDAVRQCYDAAATPETGSDTLFDHYAALAAGAAPEHLGAHRVF
ncbi:NAD(P)H-binding protein [Sulfitobacter sp. HNIBRBA3233]|uniref:NAD(P)H-binding protein n=1 Tax=Sulfitobacter marinivivus TaxID=3158558 RepID=UPI0032DF8825